MRRVSEAPGRFRDSTQATAQPGTTGGCQVAGRFIIPTDTPAWASWSQKFD
ncbi:hypothetical protein DFAR_1590009 [Desulfarculales bacterium]